MIKSFTHSIGIKPTLCWGLWLFLASVFGSSVITEPVQASTPWTTLGGNHLNINTDHHATNSSTVVIGSVTWVVWLENGNIRAKSWNGSSWTDRGQVNGGGPITSVDVADIGGEPWIAYTMTASPNNQTWVKRWTGSGWNVVGGNFSTYSHLDSEDVRIIYGGAARTAYVTWIEFAFPQVKKIVKSAVNDTATTTDLVNGSTPFNPCGTQAAIQRIDITLVENKPWVVSSSDNCVNGFGGPHSINVYRWTSGISWDRVGTERLDPTSPSDISSIYASIISTGSANETYVSWIEETGSGTDKFKVLVRRWNGSSWINVGDGGGPIAHSTTNYRPRIALSPSKELWITYADDEPGAHLVLGRWDPENSKWFRYWGDLADKNYNISSDAAITFHTVSGVHYPVITQSEKIGGASGKYRLYPRLFRPDDVGSGDVSNVAVSTTNNTATLSWDYPVGANISKVKIYRSTSSSTLGSLSATITAPTSSWTNTGLSNGVTYYYRLIAEDAQGNPRGAAFETREAIQDYGNGSGAAVATDGDNSWWFGYHAWIANKYTGESDIFTPMPNMSHSLARAKGVWAPNISEVVLLGGDRGGGVYNLISHYRPDTGSEQSKASLPAGRLHASAAYAPTTEKIYFFGGENQPENTAYDDIYEYDPVTNSVSTLGVKLPTPRSRTSAHFWPKDGCIYVLGGRPTAAQPGGANQGQRIDGAVRFCPAFGGHPASVETVGTIGDARSEFGAYTTNNEIVLVGGDKADGGDGLSNEITAFNPQTARPTQQPYTMRVPAVGTSPAIQIGSKDRGIFGSQYPKSKRMIQISAVPTIVVKPTPNKPSKPSVIQPVADGFIGNAPMFVSSVFGDADSGSFHQASEWIIYSALNCSGSVVHKVISGTDKTELKLRAKQLSPGVHSVKVRYADEGMQYSDWSSCINFTVDLTAPSMPTHSMPEIDAYVGLTPQLTAVYNDSGGSTSGRVTFQVCTNSTCSNVVQTHTSGFVSNGNQANVTASPALTSGSTYYWRAQSIDSAGNSSSWSNPTRFYPITVAVTSTSRGVDNPIPVGKKNITMEVNGTNFRAGATVDLGAGLTATSVDYVNSSKLLVTFDVPSNATVGARNVIVTNPTAPAPGGTTGTGMGVLALSAQSMSFGVTARSIDNTTTTLAPYSINFGTITSGEVVEIGTGVNGAPVDPALSLSVSSNIEYKISSSFTLFSGSAGLDLSSLAIRKHGISGEWIPAQTNPVTLVAEQPPPATSVQHDFDLQLSVPVEQGSGTFSTTWSITLLPVI